MTQVITCPRCLGKYSGEHNHSHTAGTLFDHRFVECATCHGRGAETCELCEGKGRVDVHLHPTDIANSLLMARKHTAQALMMKKERKGA